MTQGPTPESSEDPLLSCPPALWRSAAASVLASLRSYMVLKGRAQGQAQQMEVKSLIHPFDKYLSSASGIPTGTV